MKLELAVVLACSRPVAADPIVYVDGAVLLGIDQDLIAGVRIDGGVRIPKTPIWIRGAALTGLSSGVVFEPKDGSLWQLRGGAEVIACHRSDMVCGYGGVDAGTDHHTYDRGGDFATRVIAPRAGLELGNGPIRARLGFELYIEPDRDRGGAMDLTCGVRW